MNNDALTDEQCAALDAERVPAGDTEVSALCGLTNHSADPRSAMAEPMADKQVIEIAARNQLISALVAAGLEVARPERDHGVDLVAYLDVDSTTERFVAVPIQLKGSAGHGVSFWHKYRKFYGMLTVIAWDVLAPSPSFFAFVQPEIEALAAAMGWDSKESWTKPAGGWHATSPGAKLTALVAEHRVSTPDEWRAAFRRAAK